MFCEQTGFEIVGIFAWEGLMIRGCDLTTSRSGILLALGSFYRGCCNILTPLLPQTVHDHLVNMRGIFLNR